jgi:ribose/xylose/arabinose/galactoside ABC-type transport system permease subunit
MNGILVSRAGINPLIATLGTRYAVYAVANLVTAGFIQVNTHAGFLLLGRASPAGLPSTVLLLVAVVAIVHVLLRYTEFGSAVYAAGSNERAAFFSGISTRRVQTAAYAISGACAGFAGVVLASRSGAAAPDIGEGFDLEAIAAAVVGGVSIFGGAGTMLHTVAGLLLLGAVNNLLVLAGQPYEIHRIATGAILVAAIALDAWRRRGKR